MAVLQFLSTCAAPSFAWYGGPGSCEVAQKFSRLVIISSRNIYVFNYQQMDYSEGLATRETTMSDALDEEIETRFKLAGITLPADRKAQAMNSARTILKTLHWLRGPRTAAAEPSNVFSLISKES